MTLNINIRFDLKDTFAIDSIGAEESLIVTINQHDVGRMVDTNVFNHLLDHQLVPSDIVFDLLRLGMALYTVDQVVSRRNSGFQGWSRHLKVNVPVYDPDLWHGTKKNLDALLSYLSGDNWEINFRKNRFLRETQSSFERNPNQIEVVSLFSGGLDSLISAIDLLSEQKKVAFVSHYKASESKIQSELYDALDQEYGTGVFQRHKFRVQPNHTNNMAAKENSSRARSFLFLCLGIGLANSLGEEIPLIVPENGLISLNVPLTKSRLSSHSTRTTHPYYIDLFGRVLKQVGIKNRLINPYQFMTKGEMMLSCKDKATLDKLYPATISCSHPENSRFDKMKPGQNCGYCVPCIIRRAAEKRAGKNILNYAYDIIKAPFHQSSKKGEDLRAFKIGLNRFSSINEKLMVLQVLRSGPLPYKDRGDLMNYINIYKRGMEEVATFLS